MRGAGGRAVNRQAVSDLPKWAIALAAALSVALVAYALLKPKYGWDVTTYVGCAFHALDGADWSETHAKTYAYLSDRFPEAVFREMTTSPPGISTYRSIIATDPEAYRQRLSASCYKIGFMAPVIALTAAGMDVFLATRVSAAVPAGLFLFVAALWISRKIPPAWALPLAALCAWTGLLQTARYEYPDGLTALCVGGAVIALASTRIRLACALFLAAMVVRADAIVYFGMFLFFAVFIAAPERRLRFRESLIWGIAALCLWAAVSKIMTTPSYAAAFHHSFIANNPYLLDFDGTLTFEIYWEVLIRQIGVVAGKSAKYPALIVMALATAVLSWRSRALRVQGEVALVCLMMVSFHFLFIPWFDTRYYAAPYFLIAAAFGIVLYRRIAQRVAAG